MSAVHFEHLNGEQTLARLEEIQVVYRLAFPGYDLGDHTRRTRRQAQAVGFSALTAWHAAVLTGFVYGLPLMPGSGWWAGLEPPGPADFAVEDGARTFAVIDLAVVPAARGHGLGRQLLEGLLFSRGERRATLATDPEEAGNQLMYERWGWRKVGRVPGAAGTTSAVHDLYMIDLAPAAEASSAR